MRPASTGRSMEQQKSKLQIQVGNCGLFRRTEPRGADSQMEGFLDNGIVPVLSFKASPHKVQASLIHPLQAVRTELMGLATSIVDRVVGEWGCMENLVGDTRGDKINRQQAEEFLEEYLKYHNVPGKLQIRWVQKLNSGGKLQEYGRRDKPTTRRIRLWISSGFGGVRYSRSMTAFANHEICTHAVRAINDHAQVWVNHRARYGMSSGSRDRLSTEEGLASLNSLLCYPSPTRHLWSAAMLYYCAVKGRDMGFGELHKHLVKYVRCPAKRYWYCVRTKGKRAHLDQPGSCGKAQVYLEGAVEILQAVDRIDFHLLYSGKVPLSKLDRVKNIARSSLVTLPKFVQDQQMYKAVLRQIGRLNGILPEYAHLSATPNQRIRRLAKRLPRAKLLTKGSAELDGKKENIIRRRKEATPALSKSMPCSELPATPLLRPEVVGDGRKPAEDVSDLSSPARYHTAGPDTRCVCGAIVTRTRTVLQAPAQQQRPGKGPCNDGPLTTVEKAMMAIAADTTAYSSAERGEQHCDRALPMSRDSSATIQPPTQARHNQYLRLHDELDPIRPGTLAPSIAGNRGRLHLQGQGNSLLGAVSQHSLA